MKGTCTALLNSAAKFLFICVSTVILASITFGQAQSNAADLTGTVADPNEAVIRGATVTAKNITTAITLVTTSDDNGSYTFIVLPPGQYEISAEAANFKKVIISPVKLTVGQSAELTIKLEIGAHQRLLTFPATTCSSSSLHERR